jgi:hypothetical protein
VYAAAPIVYAAAPIVYAAAPIPSRFSPRRKSQTETFLKKTVFPHLSPVGYGAARLTPPKPCRTQSDTRRAATANPSGLSRLPSGFRRAASRGGFKGRTPYKSPNGEI